MFDKNKKRKTKYDIIHEEEEKIKNTPRIETVQIYPTNIHTDTMQWTVSSNLYMSTEMINFSSFGSNQITQIQTSFTDIDTYRYTYEIRLYDENKNFVKTIFSYYRSSTIKRGYTKTVDTSNIQGKYYIGFTYDSAKYTVNYIKFEKHICGKGFNISFLDTYNPNNEPKDILPLYTKGDMCFDTTGGWTSNYLTYRNGYNGTKINKNYLSVICESTDNCDFASGFTTLNKIDLTNYTELCIEYTTNTLNNSTFDISITDTLRSGGYNLSISSLRLFEVDKANLNLDDNEDYQKNGHNIKKLNIKTFKGEYYVYFSVRSWFRYGGCDVQIHNVYLIDNKNSKTKIDLQENEILEQTCNKNECEEYIGKYFNNSLNIGLCCLDEITANTYSLMKELQTYQNINFYNFDYVDSERLNNLIQNNEFNNIDILLFADGSLTKRNIQKHCENIVDEIKQNNLNNTKNILLLSSKYCNSEVANNIAQKFGYDFGFTDSKDANYILNCILKTEKQKYPNDNRIYLYNEGNECTDITNGWNEIHYRDCYITGGYVSSDRHYPPNIVRQPNYIQLLSNNERRCGGLSTDKRIDISNYKKFCIEYQFEVLPTRQPTINNYGYTDFLIGLHTTLNSEYFGSIYIDGNKDIPANTNSIFGASEINPIVSYSDLSLNTTYKKELDITNVKGKYYVNFVMGNKYYEETYNLKILNIYLDEYDEDLSYEYTPTQEPLPELYEPDAPVPNKIYLYNKGNEYWDRTGGYISLYGNNATATTQLSYISLNTTTNQYTDMQCALSSKNKFDFTKYSKIYIEYEKTGNGNSYYNWSLNVGLSSDISNDIQYDTEYIISKEYKNSNNPKETIILDIDNVIGEYYIKLSSSTNYGNVAIKIYKIYLIAKEEDVIQDDDIYQLAIDDLEVDEYEEEYGIPPIFEEPHYDNEQEEQKREQRHQQRQENIENKLKEYEEIHQPMEKIYLRKEDTQYNDIIGGWDNDSIFSINYNATGSLVMCNITSISKNKIDVTDLMFLKFEFEGSAPYGGSLKVELVDSNKSISVSPNETSLDLDVRELTGEYSIKIVAQSNSPTYGTAILKLNIHTIYFEIPKNKYRHFVTPPDETVYTSSDADIYINKNIKKKLNVSFVSLDDQNENCLDSLVQEFSNFSNVTVNNFGVIQNEADLRSFIKDDKLKTTDAIIYVGETVDKYKFQEMLDLAKQYGFYNNQLQIGIVDSKTYNTLDTANEFGKDIGLDTAFPSSVFAEHIITYIVHRIATDLSKIDKVKYTYNEINAMNNGMITE